MNDNKKEVSHSGEEGYIAPSTQNPIPVVRFEDLARGDKEVVVEYENQHYRLRVTKNGKLILNK